MNNGRYASRIDLSRFVFGGRFFDIQNPQKSLIGTYVATAGTNFFFKRELTYLQQFEVRSRLLTYNDKWIFIEHKFLVKSTKSKRKTEKPKPSTVPSGFDSGISLPDDDILEHFDKSVPEGYYLACLAISKLVVKRKTGQTVKATDCLRILGYILDVPDQMDIGVSDDKYERISSEIKEHNDKVEKIRKAGWEIGRRLLEISEIAI